MPRPTAATCPICDRPAQAATAPFCGQGCRDRDLLQWLSDGYRVPAGPAGDTDGLDSPDSRD